MSIKPTKVLFLTLAVVVIAAWPAPAAADTKPVWLSGEVVDIAGFAVKMLRIRGDEDGGRIQGLAAGQPVTLPFSTLVRIEYPGRLLMIATKKDGQRIEISEALIFSADESGQGRGLTCYKTGERGEINFYFFNHEIQQEELFTLCQAHVLAIYFGKKAAPLKYNPRTEQYFTSDFTSDPATGEPLILREPIYWNKP